MTQEHQGTDSVTCRFPPDPCGGCVLEAIAEFGVRDAFDVALATALVAVVLSWLRRSRAVLVAVGIAVVVALYSAATLAGLSLTTWLFQGFFAAFALALVVLFQDDLRQAFEEIAAWTLGRHDDHRPRLGSSGILVESLLELARGQTGALVVLPGLQRLDRHLHGGERLDGRLSRALLLSLFDPGSVGHDGAVLVRDGYVTRFGVQLPLSRHLDQLAGGGTRHSAALGLVERTDALCLVVSEERGTISAARAGRLQELRGPDEVRLEIDRFHRERRALGAPARTWVRALRPRAEYAAAAALTLGLWAVFVAGARPAERVWSVPVQVVHAPDGLRASSVEPSEVSITVRGRRLALLLSGPSELRVTADASGAREGRVDLPLAATPLNGRFDVQRVHAEGVTVELSVVAPAEVASRGTR